MQFVKNLNKVAAQLIKKRINSVRSISDDKTTRLRSLQVNKKCISICLLNLVCLSLIFEVYHQNTRKYYYFLCNTINEPIKSN